AQFRRQTSLDLGPLVFQCLGRGGERIMTNITEVGSVVSLWRYPVKSMMGEELNATEVTQSGLVGDRAYALVDSSDGKVASAKNPRKWPRLFDFRAALADVPQSGAKAPPVRVTLPNGTLLNSEQADVHQIISKALNPEVTLSALPERKT